jgi:RHS repeat-associated protein
LAAGVSKPRVPGRGIGQSQRITDGTATQTNDVLGLNNETGSPATYFTRDADGTILGERRGSASYYFLFDGLGSVVSITDASGNVSDTFSYDPYGNITATTGTLYEPIRYAGGYDDTATTGHASLVKFGQRYYDPTVGRWTQADPADTSLNLHGWNQYDYAGDDPVNGVDPSGLFPCHSFWGCVEVAPYGVYFGAHEAYKHSVIARALFGPGLVAAEAAGLGGDALVDVIEHSPACDEGGRTTTGRCDCDTSPAVGPGTA